MKPIWYFVGILLSVVGLIVVVAGVLNIVSPPPANPHLPGGHPALYQLHIDLWWGGLITVVGVLFLVTNATKRIVMTSVAHEADAPRLSADAESVPPSAEDR